MSLSIGDIGGGKANGGLTCWGHCAESVTFFRDKRADEGVRYSTAQQGVGHAKYGAV